VYKSYLLIPGLEEVRVLLCFQLIILKMLSTSVIGQYLLVESNDNIIHTYMNFTDMLLYECSFKFSE